MTDYVRRSSLALLFLVLYGGLVLLTTGWKSDNTAILILVCSLIIVHKYTYRFVLIMLGFLLFLISYNTLPAFPNYTFSDVHILQPYNLEKALFGILDGGSIVVPSEWFINRTNNFLSLIAGFSYILWMPLPMIYAGYLFFNDRDALFAFGATFLTTCIIGMIGYYIYPAAPPWYYINYGVGTDFAIPGSEGLLSEFDRLVGAPIFKGIYAQGGNVFCAIPSLHCAYPVVCFLTARFLGNKLHMTIFFFWALGTWFAAVYSQHHYIIDVILGVICALISSGIIHFLSQKGYLNKIRSIYLKELSY